MAAPGHVTVDAMIDLPLPRDVLPHRPPFLFIDRVLLCTQERVVAERTFHPEEPFFAGHFPGRPLVPGVLLLEGLAQTMAYGVRLSAPGGEVLLTGVEKARFRRPVGPGDTVTFEVVPLRARLGVTMADGVVRVGDREVASAVVKGYAGR